MDNWLDENLKKEVRKVFEPKYKRKLTEEEVKDIANNLVMLVENSARFRWSKYGKQI